MSRPEKSLETKLAEIDRRSRRLGASIGRVMTDAAERGNLLPGQTPDSPNLNAAQRARHPARRETRTEADMADRYDTIKLRLPRGDKRRLDALCAAEGQSASKLVATWIDGAERELRSLKAR